MGKTIKFCSKCDEGFAERFRFCPNCSTQLIMAELNSIPEVEKVNPILPQSNQSFKNENNLNGTPTKTSFFQSLKFPFQLYFSTWRKSFQFSGRASRTEYWWFIFVNAALYLILLLILLINGGINPSNELLFITMVFFFLAATFPSFAVTIRRFHDSGLSGWFILIGLLPAFLAGIDKNHLYLEGIGGLIFLILMLWTGDKEENRYGSIPSV